MDTLINLSSLLCVASHRELAYRGLPISGKNIFRNHKPGVTADISTETNVADKNLLSAFCIYPVMDNNSIIDAINKGCELDHFYKEENVFSDTIVKVFVIAPKIEEEFFKSIVYFSNKNVSLFSCHFRIDGVYFQKIG